MGERGISTVAAVGLAAVAAMLTSLVLMDWVVVDVRTNDPEPMHLVVPCPLLVPRIAAAFIPDDALAEATVPGELQAQREAVISAVKALAEAPDATLVSVSADDAEVQISKEGDLLRIAVDADDAVVRCTVPLDGLTEALEGWDWQTFEPGLLFDVMAAAPNGDLITVEAEDANVRVAVW